MGFFSWDCAACEKPIMNKHADDDHGRKHRGVAHIQPHDVVEGDYAGYGVVAGQDIYEWAGDGDRDLGIRRGFHEVECPDTREIKLLHRDCYTGQEYDDLEESPTAENQGYWG